MIGSTKGGMVRLLDVGGLMMGVDEALEEYKRAARMAMSKLATSAPELLEALILARQEIGDGNRLADMMDSAIAKATGGGQ